MAVEERRRSELYEGLAMALGQEAATTMFDLLPPPETELATRADLERLEVRLDHRFDLVDQRFEQMDQRFAQVDQRFAQVDQRFDQAEERLDDRIEALRGELLAAFRGELVTAVAGQTRALIVATATATFGIGGLAVTLAQVL